MVTHLDNTVSEGITEASSVTQLMLNAILCIETGQMYVHKQQAVSLTLQDLLFQ